jgi:2-keto-4-pentenoate hydratase/2-oxohepta-3-ene-1,7-dioic acid hydratase in catechol pathway
MRIVQFEEGGSVRMGVEVKDGGDIVDVTKADPSLPTTTLELLKLGDAGLAAVQKAVDGGKAPVLRLASIALKAPIYGCEKIICVGMNYKMHCVEQNMPVPTEPVIFSKFASAITDPGAPILLSPEVEELDFEVELVIVIGKEGRRIKAADAAKHVVGYTVAHDVSARDWQLKKNGGQWLIGKTFDTYAPIGPAIVTTDGLSDPHKLGLRTRLNGETVQDSNTSDLVFKTGEVVEWISRFITLKPGDLILTGTPQGVGCFRKPQLWLKEGDVVEVEIDEIGCISNTVKKEVV